MKLLSVDEDLMKCNTFDRLSVHWQKVDSRSGPCPQHVDNNSWRWHMLLAGKARSYKAIKLSCSNPRLCITCHQIVRKTSWFLNRFSIYPTVECDPARRS